MNKNRMLKRIVSIGAFLAVAANAQVCKEALLYNGPSTQAKMENSSFPEMPEWNANWGYMDGLNPPYIRFSGMKNVTADWTGALVFQSLPKTVNGGTMRMKVRSTQNVKFGTWLSGKSGTGNVVFNSLPANVTKVIEIPIEQLLGVKENVIEKIWIGLFGVPQYQYETLFIDEVSLSCSVESSPGNAPTIEPSGAFVEINEDILDSLIVKMPAVELGSAVRPSYFVSSVSKEPSAAYNPDERRLLRNMTNKKFVVNLLEHSAIQNSLQKEVSAKTSRELWYRNLFLVDSRRLEDSVIANPKAVFNEAVSMSAAYDYKVMPLLIANVDYAFSYCSDTTCTKNMYGESRLLQAGLPSSYVYGSKLKVIIDPYFVVTQKKKMPVVQLCTASKCKSPVNGIIDLEFESAGVQKIRVNMNEGGKVVEQYLFVEVK